MNKGSIQHALAAERRKLYASQVYYTHKLHTVFYACGTQGRVCGLIDIYSMKNSSDSWE